MGHALLPPFAAWANFYVIVGSSAAALTGLQFVVIVLGAQIGMLNPTALRAFGSPTIVHLSAALLISAILSAPWQAASSPGVCLAIFGVAGLGYLGLVLIHARRQSDYQLVAEDWWWHFILPAASYATLAGSAAGVWCEAPPALFVVGAAALLLLFIGIHNAWDSVTFIAMERVRRDASPST